MFDEYYDFRRRLVEAIERDLLGPGAPDEVLSDGPTTRYTSGILFPKESGTLEPSEDIDEAPALGAGAEDAGDWDPSVSTTYVRYPSSMGMTFAVDLAITDAVQVEVGAARYRPVEAGSPTDALVENIGRRGRAKDLPEWHRCPIAPKNLTIALSTPIAGRREEVADDLELYIRVRPADRDGIVSVTTILMNTGIAAGPLERDSIAWCQPTLKATVPAAPVGAFADRPSAERESTDEDIESNRLLYRNAVSIAAGHGTSVDWDEDPSNPRRATAVYTAMIPRFELRLSDSNPDIPTDSLGMAALADGGRPQALAGLRSLCDRYDAWIVETKTRVPHLEPALQAAGARHLSLAEEALSRIRSGVDLLERDSDIWEAFRLANRAMLMQRARTDWLAAGAPVPGPELSADHRWRPFQIAFMLLCLRGVADADSEDRNLTDLLWFPTGGGKTEAYLGLLAFTIALRRLRNARGHGVTVIMRYTLRLLTIQQFERATLLICCLESLRRNDNRLGDQPIEIGLWVGRGATPNSLADAKISIDKLRQGVRLEKENPLQLHRCPWCNTALDPWSVWIANNPKRLVTSCRNDKCDFVGGLPVRVVDDDLYTKHPSLIIATADKFASMPWRERCLNLFNGDLPGVSPPELIIQDELHLISGPLGTLAGLYETAVDLLCSQAGSRPKVIASTATIRRADAQTNGLFDRAVRQFPPPGIDGTDSFFAREAPPGEKGTRLYVGLTAPGTSQTTLLVRAYAAALQSAQELDGRPEVKDPYWTLVGYFNSLRVLGGARMQVQDDVGDRLALLARTHGAEERSIEQRIELTSREPSGDIPDHLRRMDISHPSEQALDVILATNMISVGVDINRLGLMVVTGQPQSTSEYIQATSRVGRRWPGLVIVLLNSAKSRDRSHYEAFRDYHSALYRQVESSSVTPFSSRARGRGLHAVLIALARLTVVELRDNEAARHIVKFVDRLEPARMAILDRVRAIDPREAEATEVELDQIIAQWIRRAEDEPNLVYSLLRQPERSLLGEAALAGEDFQSVFPTLWSLRDVDQSSNLYQVV